MSDFIAHPEVLRWLAALIAGLLLLGLALLSTRFTVRQWRDLRACWRDYRPTFVAATDQPTDAVHVIADRLLDKVLRADWATFTVPLAAYLVRGLDLALREAAAPCAEATPLSERPPAQEHLDAAA